MGNVSGMADSCKNFAEVLTVCRKYRHHCVYIFHIIVPESQIWKKKKKKLSQTSIFNIFPSSVPYNNVAKILQSNCRQTTKKYVPARCGLIGFLQTLLLQTNDIA